MLTVHLLCARNCARLFPCISPLDPHNSRRCVVFIGLPRWWSGRESTCQCRRCKGRRFDPWVRKIPQRREWQPPPYSCLENSMDRGTWWAAVHGVSKSQTWLSMHANTYTIYYQPSGWMRKPKPWMVRELALEARQEWQSWWSLVPGPTLRLVLRVRDIWASPLRRSVWGPLTGQEKEPPRQMWEVHSTGVHCRQTRKESVMCWEESK